MQDMNERPEGLIDDRLAEEAALWLARMQSSDATEHDRQRFQNWLKADPAHVTAFEEMRALWSDLGNIELLPATDKKRDGSGRAILAGLTCIGVIGLSLLYAHQRGFIDQWQADYYTEVGETRLLKLDDGTNISMNTDTAITVHYSDRERRISLLRGEAYFDVAKNPSRPFVVDDGSLTAKALGTHYSVRTASGALPREVQVEEGRVEVATGDEVTVLTPGEAATLGQDGKLLRSRKDVANSMAWREGKLVFSGQPLREVLEVLAQYRRGRILVLDDRAAEQRVSGIFDLKNTDQALNILVDSLPVTVSRLSGMLIIVRSR